MSDPDIALYRCFAATPEGGSIAGVVLSPDGLDTGTMQRIAADLGVATTGFVDGPLGPDTAAPWVRFFTPKQEIDACGYVTIAVATALVDHGPWATPDTDASPAAAAERHIRAAGGTFRIGLVPSEDGVTVEMYQRLLDGSAPTTADQHVYARLGDLPPSPSLRPWITGTGLRHLLVPVATADALTQVRLDEQTIADLAHAEHVDTIAVFSVTERGSRHLAVRLRDLCAGIGDLEEPASGTTSAAIAGHLANTLYPGSVEDVTVSVDQGHEMGRPCRIEVAVDLKATSQPRIRVRGTATPILAGKILISTGYGRPSPAAPTAATRANA